MYSEQQSWHYEKEYKLKIENLATFATSTLKQVRQAAGISQRTALNKIPHFLSRHKVVQTHEVFL